MLNKPRYSENIIVLVQLNEEWNWYVSYKELWLEIDEVDDPDYQQEFLAKISPYRVTNEELGAYVASQLFIAKDEGLDELLDDLSDDALELFPSVYVSFDDEFLYSMFAEYTSFEDYVPRFWTGRYKDFWAEIPESMRYWIVDGRDYFAQFGIP